MRILFLESYFPPEVGTGPHLAFELGEGLARAGHEMTVVTGFPRYNVRVMPSQYRRRLFYRENMAGMEVLRINAPNRYGNSKLSRGLVQLTCPPFLAFRALTARRPEVVLTDTGPLLTGIGAELVARHWRVPCVPYVTDLFPQTAIDMGLLHSRSLIHMLQALERSFYRRGSAIATLSEGYRQYIIRRGGAAERVFVVPTWADLDQIRPTYRQNEFRAAHNLDGRFVVLFAGTMGLAQGLEVVIGTARQLIDEPDLIFLLVGDGVEKEGLQKLAAGLPNVRFLPMQPKTLYPKILAACDAALVTLHGGVTTPTVPSKTMTIMAAGRPILASVPEEAGSDVRQHVLAATCGFVTSPGDTGALATAVLQLKRDPVAGREMGTRGRTYAERHFSRQVCIGKLERILRSVLADHGQAKSPANGKGSAAT